MIGPNGAGKTTVFNLVTNILSKDAGQVLFLGRDLAGMSAVKIADMGLIRTFQSARVFPGMTAIENVMVGGHRLASRSGASEMLWLKAARNEERRLLAPRRSRCWNWSGWRRSGTPTPPNCRWARKNCSKSSAR